MITHDHVALDSYFGSSSGICSSLSQSRIALVGLADVGKFMTKAPVGGAVGLNSDGSNEDERDDLD
jgi:hypothetical protein